MPAERQDALTTMQASRCFRRLSCLSRVWQMEAPPCRQRFGGSFFLCFSISGLFPTVIISPKRDHDYPEPLYFDR